LGGAADVATPTARRRGTVKVGVVGVGAVGAATALSLIERGGMCRELVLVDPTSARARWLATDRSDPQGRLLDTNAQVYADIVPKVVAAAPRAMLMVVTDPRGLGGGGHGGQRLGQPTAEAGEAWRPDRRPLSNRWQPHQREVRLPWLRSPAGVQSRHRANRQQRSGGDGR
jgi:hypothetical protein